ncbi:MAG: ribosome-associated protein [Pirellulaceae bacterium]|jgi:ribosome-associated protein
MSEEQPKTGPNICLDQFLKYHDVVGTGGQAKMVIQEGMVSVNGAIETRRRRKLVHGDLVEFDGDVMVVEFDGMPEIDVE